MKLQIVGSGVVGQATGRGLHAKGHDVTFVDIKPDIIAQLKNAGHHVSTTPIKGQDVTLISVPTPSVNGRFVMDYVQAAAESVGCVLPDGEYRVVTMRSTVPPGTVEDVILPILEETSGLTAGKDFGLCMNPELLRETSANEDFMNPPVIVIGEYDRRTGDVMNELYAGFDSVPIVRMPLKAAELFKYTSNVYGALKITFSNVIGEIANSIGVDPDMVINTVAEYSHVMQDANYGTSPGTAFGGACFPKDTLAFTEFVKSNGTARWGGLLDAMTETNRMIAAERGVVIPEYAEV